MTIPSTELACLEVCKYKAARRGNAFPSRWTVGHGSCKVGGAQTESRETARCAIFLMSSPRSSHVDSEGITAANEPRGNAPRGLGDFQGRLNRDRGWGRRDDRRSDREQGQGSREWDTPRSARDSGRRDAPSVRVPNVGWDSTPRSSREDGPGWGRARERKWDAPTPRIARDTSPEGGAAFNLDEREWEEEQVRLDRDWYTGAEDGGIAGDEEHNPLSQYSDLSAQKEAEIAVKQTVRLQPSHLNGF